MTGNIEEEVNQVGNLEFHKGQKKRCFMQKEHQKLTDYTNIHEVLWQQQINLGKRWIGKELTAEDLKYLANSFLFSRHKNDFFKPILKRNRISHYWGYSEKRARDLEEKHPRCFHCSRFLPHSRWALCLSNRLQYLNHRKRVKRTLRSNLIQPFLATGPVSSLHC